MSRKQFLSLENEYASNCAINSVIHLLDTDELLRSYIVSQGNHPDVSETQRELIALFLGVSSSVRFIRQRLFPFTESTEWLDTSEVLFAIVNQLDQDSYDLLKTSYVMRSACPCNKEREVQQIQDSHIKLAVWLNDQKNTTTISELFDLWLHNSSGTCSQCLREIQIANEVIDLGQFVIIELSAIGMGPKVSITNTNVQKQGFGTEDEYQIVAAIQYKNNNHYVTWRRINNYWVIIDGTTQTVVDNLLSDLTNYRILLYKRD